MKFFLNQFHMADPDGLSVRVIYSRIFIFLTLVTLLVLSGCTVPEVPKDLIEDLVIADIISDFDFLLFHTLGSNEGKSDLSKIPLQELERVQEMLEDNYSFDVSYNKDKATVLVDISDTGLIEWFNVKKLRIAPTFDFDERRYKVMYMQYDNGRWNLITFQLLSQAPITGWPEIPELPGAP